MKWKKRSSTCWNSMFRPFNIPSFIITAQLSAEDDQGSLHSLILWRSQQGFAHPKPFQNVRSWFLAGLRIRYRSMKIFNFLEETRVFNFHLTNSLSKKIFLPITIREIFAKHWLNYKKTQSTPFLSKSNHDKTFFVFFVFA